MTDVSTVTLSGIAALPPTTARQIGSGLVLVEASSVVKELIDNALDARAKSVFVDIAANTIDAIQVKDDGHGISSKDRPLVCRRYCTSKIRDLHDLRDVGGRWLGFRGEALSSMAEMSGSLMVTTRVEGEPMAVRLKYGRDGELASTERDSHPVGTTVKVASFFEYIPVRKQTAIKNATKCLAKIRRLIQAYVLARPGIRFRLRVLKAKNTAGDFVYAPKADASVEDAVLKMFGKDCAMQCGSAAVEADGFDIHAFLPKPTAVGSNISNYGSFVSIDARPMLNNRGVIKQLVRACKDRLGRVNASLANVRDPFFCISISCPPGSYDANVEPAKDDVLFENSDAVLRALDTLLESCYSAAVANIDSDELSLPAPHHRGLEPDEVLTPDENNDLPQEHDTSNQNEDIESRPQARWRTSMYGIDEDDLDFLRDDRAPIIDEEEGRRAIEVSNPWTIARMNAIIRPRQSTTRGQLPSPAKSTRHVTGHSSPSKTPTTPNRNMSAEPLTPQTSPKINMMRSPLDDELERSIQRLSQPVLVTGSVNGWSGERRREPLGNRQSSDSLGTELPASVLQSEAQALDNWTSLPSAEHGNVDLGMVTPAYRTIHPPQPTRDPKLSKPLLHQKRTIIPELLNSQAATSSTSRKGLSVAAGQTGENRLHSNNNNKDTRDCFRQRGEEVRASNLVQERSFTPINRPAQSIPSRPLSLFAPIDRSRPLLQKERAALPADSAGPRTIRDYLQAYSARAGARPTSSPTASQISMPFDQRPATTTRQFTVYKGGSATLPAFHALSAAHSERSSPASPQSSMNKQSRTHLHSQSIDQMTAFFQSHLEKAATRPSQRLSRTAHSDKSQRPTVPSAVTDRNPSHPKVPLHNRIFNLSTTAQEIIRQALVRHEHVPKWDCVAEDAYRSFSEVAEERRIVAWVCRLDSMLCAMYARKSGMTETRGVLVEGVRRALGEGERLDGGRDEDGEGDQENDGVYDDVVADDDGDEYDDDDVEEEEEMLMDL